MRAVRGEPRGARRHDEGALERHRGLQDRASWTRSCRSSAARLQQVETASKELGLRECAAHDEHVCRPRRGPRAGLRPAARGPRPQAHQARPSGSTPAASHAAGGARSLRELERHRRTPTRAGSTTSSRPYWARKESDDYVAALRDARHACWTRAPRSCRDRRSPRPRPSASTRSISRADARRAQGDQEAAQGASARSRPCPAAAAATRSPGRRRRAGGVSARAAA